MNKIIKTLLFEWKERSLPDVKERTIPLENYLITPRKIIVITGFRRVGKTYLCFQLIKTLLAQKDKEEVIYINFEDERVPQKSEVLTDLIPTIKETFRKKTYIIFLDEIQEMEQWSKWLRRMYDTEDCYFFVTGSSSKMSLHEIPTELRGRFLIRQVFPLSFEEFLYFKDKQINKKELPVTSGKKAEMLKLLEEYLTYGGLPEVVLTGEESKKELLQNYYRTVVNRDIIEKFQVRNEEGMKALLRLLLHAVAYSHNKLYHTLKSMNIIIGKTSLIQYISYIEKSYFMYSLPIFSRNVKDQLQYPRKVYFVDNGFITALSVGFSDKRGRLYENLVFLELQRRMTGEQEYYYWRSESKEEVDFVVKDGLKVKSLIQVSVNVDDYDTKKREVRALLKASKELHCSNLFIITEGYEQIEKIKGKNIQYIPLWKWLLM